MRVPKGGRWPSGGEPPTPALQVSLDAKKVLIPGLLTSLGRPRPDLAAAIVQETRAEVCSKKSGSIRTKVVQRCRSTAGILVSHFGWKWRSQIKKTGAAAAAAAAMS